MKAFLGTTVLLILTGACHLGIQWAQNDAAKGKPTNIVLDIPRNIGGYKQIGDDVEVDESVIEILQTSSIIQRQYISPRGWPLMLSLVHAGKTRRSLHFPEVCLVGQGWEIREQYSAPVGFQFTAKRLILDRGNQQEAVLYWFKTADKFTGNYFVNSWYWAQEQLTLGTPTSTLIKLSTFVGPQGIDASFAVLEDMALKLAPIVMENVE